MQRQFFLILITVGCFCGSQIQSIAQQIKRSTSNLVKQSNKTTALNNQNYPVRARPAIFETAFFKGTQVKTDSLIFNFSAINVGTITVSTGKLIACDPIVMNGAHPFSKVFPVGIFPVQLAIAKFDNDERVAYSQIVFLPSHVERWEFALLEGQKPESIYSASFYGYSVDGGMGLFIDSSSNAIFAKLVQDDGNLWTKIFDKRMKEQSSFKRGGVQFAVYDFQNHNLVAFATGFGDGRYGTYIGYDASGKICRLLSDFNVINWFKM